MRGATGFEHQADLVDPHGDDPAAASIQKEEAEMLDRTLANMPESYREPLVLFYREQQSVARVAELLEITPDAVKQRLARGRMMLRDEIAAAVERGLQLSAPGRAFTVGVLAALPVMTGSAKAATITVTTAKGVSAMNAAGLTGMVGAIVGPIVGLLGGWFGYSMSLRSARSDRERSFIRRMTGWILVLILVFGTGVTLVALNGKRLIAFSPFVLATAIGVLVLGYMIALVALIVIGNRTITKIRSADGTLDEDPSISAARVPTALRAWHYPRHYDSRVRFLGLPLISVRFHGTSRPINTNRRSRTAAVGWIALGDAAAYGVLFASGTIAVGGIAVGAVGLGLVSFGGLSTWRNCDGGLCGWLCGDWRSRGGLVVVRRVGSSVESRAEAGSRWHISMHWVAWPWDQKPIPNSRKSLSLPTRFSVGVVCS